MKTPSSTHAEQVAASWLTLATSKEPVRYTDKELSDIYSSWTPHVNSLDAAGRARLGPEFKDAFIDRDSRRIHRAIANIASYIFERGREDRKAQNGPASAKKRRENGNNTLTLVEAWERETGIPLTPRTKQHVALCAAKICRSETTVIDVLRERRRRS